MITKEKIVLSCNILIHGVGVQCGWIQLLMMSIDEHTPNRVTYPLHIIRRF